mgnify:CR=1 FL=1
MKKHITVIRYMTVYSSDVDFRTTDVSCVPRREDIIVIENNRGVPNHYVIEDVVWAVGKLCTEAQVRLLPWKKR